MSHSRRTTFSLIYRYVLVIVGAVIAAASIELFLLPNNIIDGGIIGISLILNSLTNLNFGILVFILNIPFLFFGFKYIGKRFLFFSLTGIVALALAEAVLHQVELEALTHISLLATIFGGLMLGVGVGIVIRYGGALDGTEIMGLLLMKKLPFTVGECVLVFNIFVFAWASFVYGIDKAMYSVLTYYVAAKTIDAVVEGMDGTKAVMVVSGSYEEMTKAITSKLGRGVTRLKAEGGYRGDQKDVLYVVVTRLEVMPLKNIIYEVDRNAFFTIMDTHESKGSSFKSVHDH
ncbi:YitT family protein [Shouchella shacheensis]|uniref:YitT family protein n=1 Tax=Shouchella shacheensis TaxID=1649580 RepID=UPI00073FDDC9|nr:YitT family protein [Shouchella shacheensis]